MMSSWRRSIFRGLTSCASLWFPITFPLTSPGSLATRATNYDRDHTHATRPRCKVCSCCRSAFDHVTPSERPTGPPSRTLPPPPCPPPLSPLNLNFSSSSPQFPSFLASSLATDVIWTAHLAGRRHKSAPSITYLSAHVTHVVLVLDTL
jgi:hypothetical protein